MVRILPMSYHVRVSLARSSHYSFVRLMFNPAARQSIAGMKSYYEHEEVEHNGDVYLFALYRSSIPGTEYEVGRYMINCETHDVIRVISGQASPAKSLIAGEDIYRVLC